MTTKKPFWGFGSPHLEHTPLPAGLERPEPVPVPPTMTLLHRRPAQDRTVPVLKLGDTVQTGQKISLYGTADYVTSPVTGKIAALSAAPGGYGRSQTAIAIAADAQDVFDSEFDSARGTPTLDMANTFLSSVPGQPDLGRLADAEHPIKTLVVSCVDEDLLVVTRQYMLATRLGDIQRGIRILKQLTGIQDVVILVRREALQGHGSIDGRVVEADHRYPAALPALVMARVFGQIVPAGQTCADLGFCFLSAEAVASIGAAFSTGRVPVVKTMTVVSKDRRIQLAEARIGTPVGDVLKRFGVPVAEGDRIVVGGPMRGTAVFSLDHRCNPTPTACWFWTRRRPPTRRTTLASTAASASGCARPACRSICSCAIWKPANTKTPRSPTICTPASSAGFAAMSVYRRYRSCSTSCSPSTNWRACDRRRP